MTPEISTNDRSKKQQTDGLRYVSHRFGRQKYISSLHNNGVGQSNVANENVTSKQLFFVDDDLKDLFQNEMHAHHFGLDESDEAIVK